MIKINLGWEIGSFEELEKIKQIDEAITAHNAWPIR